MTWAAVAAAGVSAAGSVFSGISSSNSIDEANDANQRNARETNALNKLMFDQSRGSEGHAVLPTYLGGAEQELGARAVDASRLLFGNPTKDLARDQGIVDAYLPSSRGVRSAVDDLFSGANLDKRLGILKPVNEARTAKAGAKSVAINQSVRDAISRLESSRARGGFIGGGSFDRNRLLASTIAGRTAAGEAVAGANLDNQLAEGYLRDADIQARLAGVDLPGRAAAGEIALRDLPRTSGANRYSNAMAPMNFFRMQPQAFRANPLPQVTPGIGGGEIVGGALSGAGNAMGQYLSNKALADALSKGSGTFDGLPAAGGGYSRVMRDAGFGGGPKVSFGPLELEG